MPKRLLAFDFGLKHIGVACGQTLTKTAQPIAVLKANQGTPRWSEITALIEQWRPDALVVGIPLNMDNTDMSVTEPARRFAKKLQQHTQLETAHADEKLTTKSAKSRWLEIHDKLPNERLDALAACLILESYMANLA